MAVLCDKEIYIVIADKASKEFVEYTSDEYFDHQGITRLKDSL